ncbi:MAG: DUF389 domain-containing protein [Acidobacteria bacterium]|nr:DUF389 domain-containing protein [Acidobacteriota bacterium]
MFEASEVVSLNYALELLLSAGIATLGLVLDSPAVVIGAMLISPLMGPILAAGLALASADLYLGIKSLLSIVIGVALSVLFAAWLVWMLPFQSTTHEILARTNPNLLDLGVALFSGFSGAIVVSRGGSGGGVTALPGVAIAVALMPPLCTAGFGVGSGFSLPIISGACLLFLTNLAAIIASAFLVFYLVRMDSPVIRETIDAAILERATNDRLYKVLQKTGIARSFGHIGKLRWRIVMLLAVLAILFVPLRQSLLQVRDETRARAAIGEALRALAPGGTIVTQLVDLKSTPILIRLVIAGEIDRGRVRAAESIILRRTGRDVNFQIRHVAGDEELARLRDRLQSPASSPAVADVESVRADLMSRLEQPLKLVWPEDAGKLQAYELGLTPEQVLVRVSYESPKPFDAPFEQTLANVLRSALHLEKLQLILEHHPPPRPPRNNRQLKH